MFFKPRFGGVFLWAKSMKTNLSNSIPTPGILSLMSWVISPRLKTLRLRSGRSDGMLAIRGECIYEKDTGVNYKELLNVKASTGAMAAALQVEALRMKLYRAR
jgi:hypothetical protein